MTAHMVEKDFDPLLRRFVRKLTVEIANLIEHVSYLRLSHIQMYALDFQRAQFGITLRKATLGRCSARRLRAVGVYCISIGSFTRKNDNCTACHILA